MSMSTASLMIPNASVGTTYVYGTRDVQITPAVTYGAAIRTGVNTITHLPFAIADFSDNYVSDPQYYPLRVAAVVSRILLMPDNGVPRNGPTHTAPTLTVQTNTGCYQYAGNLLGECCTALDGNTTSFGVALSYADPNNPVSTGHHTTEEIYTIAHELGHAMSYGSGGGPNLGQAGYGDITGEGICSCQVVSTGNRIHCLNSRWTEAAGLIEGFAHFYATRVTNDQDSVNVGANFTYYKDAYTKQSNGSVSSAPPPIPINAGTPFALGSTSGWVRNECYQSAQSSEYDFLTFLWAVNGNAPTSSRASMADLYAIFAVRRS